MEGKRKRRRSAQKWSKGVHTVCLQTHQAEHSKETGAELRKPREFYSKSRQKKTGDVWGHASIVILFLEAEHLESQMSHKSWEFTLLISTLKS